MRNLLKKILPKRNKLTATVTPRAEHCISRNDISGNALKVLYRLKDAGHEGYLVGGCVRDLLLGLKPKDFDVATNAKPEQVRKCFRNCQLIGRRFRLAHVRFRNEIIEVATFRKDHGKTSKKKAHMEDGMIIRDNVYGDIDDDAIRRDFTVNALYYDIRDFSIVDFMGGMEDLENKIIRSIGDTEKRFKEDPARLLRAIRFMSQLDFQLAEEIENAIPKCRELLTKVSPSRMFLEIIKAFHKGHAVANFENLKKYDLLSVICPSLKGYIDGNHKFFKKTFANTDERIKQNKPVTPGFLFAALLWPAVKGEAKKLREQHKAYAAIETAAERVIREQLEVIAVPKRFTVMAREIWRMQHLLCKRNPRGIFRLYRHPRFRAAYDLLCVRAHGGDNLKKYANWWTTFQEASRDEQDKMIAEL